MKRKLVFGVLCMSMILSARIGVSAAVSEKHSSWAEESLIKAEELKLLPNFFSDSDLTSNITRIDFCHLAYKMLDKKSLITGNGAKSSFADTDDNEVAALANAGIINGRSETEFAPNDDITREEAAVILTNTAKFMGVKEDITLFDTCFSDFDTVSDWAEDSVRKMDSLGIMRGVGENNFSPKSNYTMEQSVITMLKLFNLDVSDYASNVYEVKIDGDLSLFYSKDKQWIKNAGKNVLIYDAPEEDIADNERSFVFFEKSGKWYFYIHNNKSENYIKNNKCSDIYNAETGNIDYELMVDALDTNQGRTDHIDFADDYYMVTTYGSAGAEPVSYLTNMELYTYEGEKIASSHYSSYSGGDFLDKDEYPCNNRQIRVDFDKAKSPLGEYFVQGKNLIKVYPYLNSKYEQSFSYFHSETLKGYTPVKLSSDDKDEYIIYNPNGEIIHKSDKELFIMPYENNLCFGEADEHIISVYDILTREHIASLDWEENQQYKSADDYMANLLAENIESECTSPKGNYTVNGYNMLLDSYIYPKDFTDFLETEGFSGYTPMYKYERDALGGHMKYYIYNPDGDIFLESDTKMYLLKRDNKVCYTKVNEINGKKEIGVYSLSDGELVSTFEYNIFPYYSYNKYDIMDNRDSIVIE